MTRNDRRKRTEMSVIELSGHSWNYGDLQTEELNRKNLTPRSFHRLIKK